MFFGITETRLNSLHDTKLYEVDGFNLLRFDRVQNNGGGCLCYFNNKCSFVKLDSDSTNVDNLEIHIFKVNVPGLKTTLVPP